MAVIVSERPRIGKIAQLQSCRRADRNRIARQLQVRRWFGCAGPAGIDAPKPARPKSGLICYVYDSKSGESVRSTPNLKSRAWLLHRTVVVWRLWTVRVAQTHAL